MALIDTWKFLKNVEKIIPFIVDSYVLSRYLYFVAVKLLYKSI